jgi:anti-sigma regulatory factor (Ser/Thr protein kinase)
MCATALECERPATDMEIRLDPDKRAPGEARRFVRVHLEKLGYPKIVDDAVIVVSELVTNAMAAAPYTPIFVALRLTHGRPLLEVWDMSPDPPVLRKADETSIGGRGLRIVQELSVTFGWNQKGRWKVVWSLLDGV